MPQQLTYPGVYVEEIPSGVRTIIGVSTSITAFVGRALRGPVDEPVRVQNYGEYERQFGGLWNDSAMSFAVKQYFDNGGADAIIVRAYKTNSGSTLDATEIAIDTLDPDGGGSGTEGTATFVAASNGAWGNNLVITVLRPDEYTDTTTFDLIVSEVVSGVTVAKEVYYTLSSLSTSARYVKRVLENQSALVRVKTWTGGAPDDGASAVMTSADDGDALTSTEVLGSEGSKTGVYALEKADIFNLLVIPPLVPLEQAPSDYSKSFWASCIAYCKKRRAMLLVHPKVAWNDKDDVVNGLDDYVDKDENAAIYFPHMLAPNPLRNNQIERFVPTGAVAGLIARTDTTRGIWKAPAGIDATVLGVQAFELKMTDGENGQLNPLGVNCLRQLPAAGNVAWGARTLKGADRLASEWKYLPVRRLALYIEESLYRGSQWAVFEPNDEPLWAQLRMNVGAFMHQLYRQGAFQGRSPREAYFVKCDKETTTQNDINQGIVNVLIGFAPLKPAEFVVLKIQQIAGQIES